MSVLAYETLGAADAPVLMLVHGFMSSNAQWLANRAALAREFRLVMVELWGHGRSPEPEDPACVSVDGYVAEFERIRREVGAQRWGLIGQSYGAGLTIRYALAKPSRCVGVLVTNSRSAFGRIGASPERAQRSLPDAASFEPRRLPYHPIHARRFPEHVKAALVADADGISAATVRNGGVLGAGLNCVAQLADLTVPVEIVNGLYEKPFQRDLEMLRERMPGLDVVDLEGGHSVNVEAASEFDAAACAFFERAFSILPGADG